jgi:hypothetical protein
MAITVLSEPADFASLHDDMWFVVESDNVAIEDFKYVYDVYVSGKLVARVKNNPAPSGEGSYGIFNSAPIVRNYVNNYFEPSGNSVLQCTSDQIKVVYQVAFGEEASGIITNPVSGALTYSGYNFYPPLFFDGILLLGNGGDLILSDQYDNLLISNYANDWLTERNIQSVDLIFGKRMYISFLSTTYTQAAVEVQKISETGDIGSAASGALLSIDEFSLWDLSAARINEYLGSTFITEDDYGYKVRLVFSDIESNWVTIKHVCYDRTNPVNVHFLNRLGGWDSFGFNLINKRSTQFERRSFQRAAYQLSGSDMTNTDQYNRFNEGKINFSTQHVDRYKLISDYISENDYHWLAQLVASPLVYLEVGGAYFPITVIDNNYEYKLEKSDMLFNLELNIEVGKYNNSQYR